MMIKEGKPRLVDSRETNVFKVNYKLLPSLMRGETNASGIHNTRLTAI